MVLAFSNWLTTSVSFCCPAGNCAQERPHQVVHTACQFKLPSQIWAWHQGPHLQLGEEVGAVDLHRLEDRGFRNENTFPTTEDMDPNKLLPHNTGKDGHGSLASLTFSMRAWQGLT